jgi:hypothetical protein
MSTGDPTRIYTRILDFIEDSERVCLRAFEAAERIAFRALPLILVLTVFPFFTRPEFRG